MIQLKNTLTEGPRFGSDYPHISLQHSVTLGQSNSTPLSVLCRQNTHTRKILIILIIKKLRTKQIKNPEPKTITTKMYTSHQ